ncbi:hypothetical protein MNBD_NITROSPIRAE01-2333 [hydrothermal vent metagenome]|uniref:Uncharacterized protein n=1 Tax=hydrothermal vent metagenome TaxID=652676 RepID=A0A3B1CD46_9ZZZZ
MFIGVNTNIRYRDETFHIQTEDGGLDQHTLTTILFKNGAILSSKKTSYIDIEKSPTYNDTIKTMMQEQHKQMARDLVRGKFENSVNAQKKDSLPETKKVPEENNTSTKTVVAVEEVKEEVAVAGVQQKSVHGDVLDGLIVDYLEKKDAKRE